MKNAWLILIQLQKHLIAKQLVFHVEMIYIQHSLSTLLNKKWTSDISGQLATAVELVWLDKKFQELLLEQVLLEKENKEKYFLCCSRHLLCCQSFWLLSTVNVGCCC